MHLCQMVQNVWSVILELEMRVELVSNVRMHVMESKEDIVLLVKLVVHKLVVHASLV